MAEGERRVPRKLAKKSAADNQGHSAGGGAADQMSCWRCHVKRCHVGQNTTEKGADTEPNACAEAAGCDVIEMPEKAMVGDVAGGDKDENSTIGGTGEGNLDAGAPGRTRLPRQSAGLGGSQAPR